MNLKVMYYNILHGFHSEKYQSSSNQPFIFHPQRLIAAKQAINNESPDVLVLGEAAFGKPFFEKASGKTIHIDYQNEFNFEYYCYVSKDYEWGTAILSRFPIQNLKDETTDKRTFIKCEIVGPNIFLYITHPHPILSEIEKEKFIDDRLRNLKKPCLLVGDFNSLSDDDIYEEEKLTKAFIKVMGEKAKIKIKDMLQCLTIKAVKKHGLLDTFILDKKPKPWDYTIPTDFLSPDKNSGIRIDYIFCSPEIKVIEAEIVKNQWTEKGSDHYPVTAVLNIP
jgi:endonuclease/exonuclease/phosphatase family metal-dependent hydrolase